MLHALVRSVRSKLKAFARPVFRTLRGQSTGLFTVRSVSPQKPIAVFSSGDRKGSFAKAEGSLNDDTASTLEPPGSNGMQRFLNYGPSRVEEVLHQIRVCSGHPESNTLQDAIYIPTLHCLYSRDGRRIDSTHMRIEDSLAPPETVLPKRLPEFEGDVLYIGSLSNHYGHFVTEGISRLCCAARDEGLPLLTHELEGIGRIVRPGSAGRLGLEDAMTP